MIECDSSNCITMIYDGSRGLKANGKVRRNTSCARCMRLKNAARVCSSPGCTTILSKHAKAAKRCAKCVRMAIVEAKPKHKKNARVKGVFVRDCSSGSTDYIKVGIVDKMGNIHLFSEVVL